MSVVHDTRHCYVRIYISVACTRSFDFFSFKQLEIEIAPYTEERRHQRPEKEYNIMADSNATQKTASLPRREQYLSTGLVPFAASSSSEGIECNICYEENAEEPVHPGCHTNHVFCRAHLTRWLEDHNTCPVCKTQLYRQLSRREAYVERAGDILHGQDLNSDNMETFGAGPFQTPEEMENLGRSNQNARWFLAHSSHTPGQVRFNNQIQTTAGTGTINTARLRTDVAILGNYIPAVSEARNHPYTAQERQHWTLVLRTLWGILQQ